MFGARRLSGLATVFAVGLALGLTSCGDDGTVLEPNEGGVQFVLSSDASGALAGAEAAPAFSALDGCDGDCRDGDRPALLAANVTFSSILARNLDGVLVDVDMELPATVDLIPLRETKEITLPVGVLPPATYDQIVVVMTQVEVMTRDSTVIAITPPGGGWTAIVPVCRFDVADGATTTVGLRFDFLRAFSWRDGHHEFKPGFSCGAPPSDGTGGDE